MKAVVVLLLLLPNLEASVLPIGSYFPFGDSFTSEGTRTEETTIPTTTTKKGIEETTKSTSDEGLTEDQYYDYYYGDERSGSGDHHGKEGQADDDKAEASGEAYDYGHYYGDGDEGSGSGHDHDDVEEEYGGDDQDNMRSVNETQEEQEVRNYLQMMHRIRFSCQEERV